MASLPNFFNLSFFDTSVTPAVKASGYSLHTYITGTSTNKTTWTNEAATIANTNPIVLDGAGNCTAYLDADAQYAFELRKPASLGGGLVKRWDDIGSSFEASNALRAELAGTGVGQGAQNIGFNPSILASAINRVDWGIQIATEGTSLWRYIPPAQWQSIVDGTLSYDCTADIQAWVNSLPLNTADVGILTPKGFANGGKLFAPRGRYRVNGKISLRRGINMNGAGSEATQFVSFIANDSVFQYTDSGRYIPDALTFSDFSIWQDESVVSTAGAAIDVIEGPATLDAVKVSIKRVHIEGHFRGHRLGAGIACEVEQCTANKCVSSGFNIKAGVTSTSTTFKNCYATLTSAGSGFDLEAGAYVSFVGCASDSNSEFGYKANGCKTLTFVASGAEANQCFGSFSGCESVTGTIFGIANSVDGVQLSSCREVVLGGVLDGATGFGVNVLVALGTVKFLGMTFKNTYATNRCNSVFKVLDMDADGGFVGGFQNRWGVGVLQQPDSESTWNVGGNGGAATTVGDKSNVSFSVAGASRNAARWSQVLTANTAVIYPLVIGDFILNASKGAAATHTRAAGVFVQEQTTGATANANIVVSSTGAAIPAGNWSLWSESARPSSFGGALKWRPDASVSGASLVNGDLSVEATSNTSITFRHKGTDGVVRSASLALV